MTRSDDIRLNTRQPRVGRQLSRLWAKRKGESGPLRSAGAGFERIGEAILNRASAMCEATLSGGDSIVGG